MSERTTLDYALEYIGRGWSVIPLLPRSKQPAVKIADFLSGKARFDKHDAHVWWGDKHKDHGIAIITGKPSGLVVIDVDPRNGGDGEYVIASNAPTSCVFETGGGGVHFLCRYPDIAADRIPCGKTMIPGVDRKGDGGYIVAPPSIHPSGQPYRIMPGRDGQPGNMPDWVLSAPAPSSPDGNEPGVLWVADTLSSPHDCKPGSQEDTLSRLCWWAAGNLEPDIAQAVIGSWLARVPLGNPHDPWTFDHVVEKLDRAYEKRVALDPGNAGPLVDDVPVPTGMFEVVADLTFPEQQWIVEDFAAPGCFTELIGKVKKGKSTLAYQLIAAVCAGEPFIGRATVQGGVVLLTEQTGTSLKKTLERAQLLGSRDVHVLQKPRIMALGGWSKAVHAATTLCRETGIRLIVVDTLSRLASIGGDQENSSGAVSVLDPFMAARELGVACVFVRHARKGQSGIQDEIADAARGSSAITGDMDIVLRLATAEGDLRCLSWESRITDDPEDVYLEYHEGTYEVVEKPEGKREQNERDDLERLRAAIQEHGEKRNVLAKALGWGNAKTDRLLKKLKTYTHGPCAAPPEDE